MGGTRIRGFSLLKLWRDCLSAIEHELARAPFSAIAGIWATEAGWLATRAATRLGLRSLVHLAGGELTYVPQIDYGNWGRGIAGRLVKDTLRRATIVTVPSLSMRASLVGAGVDANKVREWAPGVDTEMFAPREGSNENRAPFSFVTIGSLIPVKGHELLLHALAAVRQQRPNRDVHLRVVGSGRLASRLLALAHQLQLEGYVTFEGDKAHEELPALYSSCDAFLLGSWHEAQCMAALEAMSCGLPWVGPPVGSLPDVEHGCADEPCGIIFRERSPESVAKAMTRIIDLTPHERLIWGSRARAQIVHRFEMREQAARFVALLDRLTVEV